MRSVSLLLYLSLGATAATAASVAAPGRASGEPAPTPAGGASGAPGPAGTGGARGPLPGYLALHAKTRGFSLGRPLKPTPTPDGKHVLFLRAAPDSPELRIYEFDVATGSTRELLSPARLLGGAEENLSTEERARRERMRQSLRGFTSFELSPDGSFLLIPLSGRLYRFVRAASQVTELVPAAEGPVARDTPMRPGDDAPLPASSSQEPIFDPQLSPDGKTVGYVRGRDLYVYDLATRRERRLTRSTNPYVSYGLSEFVAQEELHRFTGFFFSPDGQSIAFAEVDNRPVETLYVGDVLRPELPPQPLRYPRAGTDNAIVRLGVLPVRPAPAPAPGRAASDKTPVPAAAPAAPASPGFPAGAPVWIEWSREEYPYLATVVWQQGGPLLLTVLSRTQKALELLRADARTGTTQRVLSERNDAWINLDQDMPRVLKDGSGFLWTSEASGDRELELRDLSGGLRRVLVPRSEGFRKLLDLDEQAGTVTYAAATEPSEQHLYRTSLLGGTPVSLEPAPAAAGGLPVPAGQSVISIGLPPPGTTGAASPAPAPVPGWNLASFGRSHEVYVRQAMSLTGTPRFTVHRVAATGQPDTAAGELPSVAQAPPFVPKVEIAQVGAANYRVALVRPRHFQAGKKYPVLVHVYGGPHHTQVMAVGGMWMLDQWLADHGFIVVAADGRGTPNRGTAWERSIAGNFGDLPLEDQVEALKAAGQRFPELDLKRVGVYGWSFGGYMAALSVLRRPDVFHVGVAGAPVVDWRDYDTAYTERYLGLPGENADGYARSSLLTYAKDLRRPLLIIHGTADDNVLFMHSLKLSNALFRAGKPHELLPLPGLTHMVPDPTVTERMWARILTVLSTTLKPEFPPPEAAAQKAMTTL